VSVQIHDNGGTANGGVDTSAVQTFIISVVANLPTLGDYPDTTVNLGANTTIIPSAAPTLDDHINVETSTNFKGILTADPLTGIVRLTNASTAGTYTVAVKAFEGAASVTKTFTLTVQAGGAPCAGVTQFSNAADVGGITNPTAVAVGDFDNDGKQDLAIARNLGTTISIRLGNGAGAFSGSTEVTVGNNAQKVAIGDFNNDGNQDLAVANFSAGTVSIRLGNGAGNFTGTDVAVGVNPTWLAIGDFNNDGKQDLAVTLPFTPAVAIRLGDGLGGFSAAPNVSVGANAGEVAIGDFNNDGKPDLAVTSFNTDAVAIRLGDGAGNFSGSTNVSVGDGPLSVATGDFNGDGNQDFAAANSLSFDVSIALGDGTGAFLAAPSVAVGSNAIPVVIGDFNGDGKQDLLVGTGNLDVVAIRFGDGAGGFFGATSVSVGDGNIAAAIGDFNGDGKQDFATANTNSNNISIRLGGGCNLAPTINAASGLSRRQGSAATNSKISTVTDDGVIGSVTVKVNGATSATVNGVTVSNIVNTGGNITADIMADCTASDASFALLASDSLSTASATLNVTVNPNTAPILSYLSPQNLTLNGSLNLNPTALPGDNGSIASIVLQNAGAFTGAISVNSATGAVSISNAAPAGTHAITIRATDNCGQTTDAAFSLVIPKADTTTALSSSGNPSAIGDPVTFAATVSSSGGVPTGTVTFKDNGNAIASCANVVLIAGQASCTTSSFAPGNHPVTAEYSGDTNFNPSNATLLGGQTVTNGFRFSQPLFTVAEQGGAVTITVQRIGDASQAASVDYETDDGSIPTVALPCSTANGRALERCDYERATGRLNFAASETQKTFVVLINDDSYVEGPETTLLRLSNPVGGALAQESIATLQISDDAQESAGNPIDDDENFVAQHYRDFLNREPDPSGLKFWVDGIKACGNDQQCREVKRINTSAAFFVSIEFQATGFFIERVHKAGFGDGVGISTLGGSHQLSVPVVRLATFMRDAQQIRSTPAPIIVNQGSWQQQLVTNKQAFALDFVRRPEFMSRYPALTSATAFVNLLDANAGGVLNDAEKSALIAELSPNSADATLRANVLRKLADNAIFQSREFNRAFVLMQYFGYLRRNPNDAQDNDYSGYENWLKKLEQFNGDFIQAQMVKAFINSDEFRKRFGP
jgi:hypothetical protein